MLIYWDDLLTIGSGRGVFTTTTGSQPNRQFIIEFRTGYVGAGGIANFEVIFSESGDAIRTVYGTVTRGGSRTTEGIQASGTGPFSQYGCNGAGGPVSSGLAVSTPRPQPRLRHLHLRRLRLRLRRHHRRRRHLRHPPSSGAWCRG